MPSIAVLKRKVEKIEQKSARKHPVDLVVIFSFGPDDEPHGKYGYRKVHMNTGEVEACTEEEELEE